MKEGWRGGNHHTWEKQAEIQPSGGDQHFFLCHQINQINEWNPTVLGKKKVLGKFRHLHILQQTLWTNTVAYQHSCFSELFFVGILTVYGHISFPCTPPYSPLFPSCCSSKLCPIVLPIPWHWNCTSQLSNKGEDSRITNAWVFIYMLTPITPEIRRMAKDGLVLQYVKAHKMWTMGFSC